MDSLVSDRACLIAMDQLDDDALNIFTDGSSYTSPRVGGTGYLFVIVGGDGQPLVHEESPAGWKGATNNQMELQACIEALSIATGRRPPFDSSRYEKIVIFTDSQYVADNFARAIFEWSTNRWKTRSGAPVANTPQWKELVKLVHRANRMRLRVQVKWIKGHGTSPYNKRADKLAKQSAKSPGQRTIRPVRVRRKKSPNRVEVGSVRMKGQIATVHIVTDEYLPPPHDCYKYMYEVMDEDNPFFQCVDKITSHVMLGAGHTYAVRFNEDALNPRIEEMLTEILD